MNLILRLIKVLVMSLLRPALTPLGESVVRFRVWPHDLDLNLHMNNGRYLTVMDLGRTDLMIRCRMLGAVLKRGWRPMLAAATIRYRRPLAPFRRYELRTRLVGWDQKWFFMEQRFEVGGDLYAYALVKGVFKDGRGVVPPSRVAQILGHDNQSPQWPAALAAWLTWEQTNGAAGGLANGQTGEVAVEDADLGV